MKRLSLYLFLLLFTLQTPSQADDIRDYEIEGLSIGSSALDHISEEIIKKNTWNYYKDKTFTPVQINRLSFFKTYDAIDINYKTDDKNYIIHGLSGIIMYQNNINDCYKKMDKIVLELSKVFEDEVKQEKKKTVPFYEIDKSGKSKLTIVNFWFDSDDRASVTCYDYSEEISNQDHFNISFMTKEFNEFLVYKAYTDK